MPDPASGTANACVVSLALGEPARQGDPAQARLKERLEDLLARALEALDAEDRIVAETAEGATVIVLGAPTDALMLARRARRAAREAGEPLGLGVGVALGPVGMAIDPAGEIVLVGDGIAAGAAIAGAAPPGEVLVSRAFRDALAATDAERAERLGPAAALTDAARRTHEVYAFDPSSEHPGADTAPPPKRGRVVLLAVVAAIGLLGAGVVVRSARHAYALAHRPAAIELAITPYGEVRIDGEHKGRTPPLRRVELAAGKHTIEVRHPSFAPVTVEVELEPGEEMTLRHAFGASTAPQRSAGPQGQSSGPRELWRDFRRQLGF